MRYTHSFDKSSHSTTSLSPNVKLIWPQRSIDIIHYTGGLTNSNERIFYTTAQIKSICHCILISAYKEILVSDVYLIILTIIIIMSDINVYLRLKLRSLRHAMLRLKCNKVILIATGNYIIIRHIIQIFFLCFKIRAEM